MNFDDLVLVNSKVNLLPYKSEVGDDWMPIVDEGDCDSYATEKYNRLVLMGWPKSALRLACCYVENNLGYHAVLLADFDGQTWVLDNRYPHPVEFQLLPYKWDRIQKAGSMEWEMA